MGNFGKELREAMLQLVMQEKGLTKNQVEEILLKKKIEKLNRSQDHKDDLIPIKAAV